MSVLASTYVCSRPTWARLRLIATSCSKAALDLRVGRSLILASPVADSCGGTHPTWANFARYLTRCSGEWRCNRDVGMRTVESWHESRLLILASPVADSFGGTHPTWANFARYLTRCSGEWRCNRDVGMRTVESWHESRLLILASPVADSCGGTHPTWANFARYLTRCSGEWRCNRDVGMRTVESWHESRLLILASPVADSCGGTHPTWANFARYLTRCSGEWRCNRDVGMRTVESWHESRLLILASPVADSCGGTHPTWANFARYLTRCSGEWRCNRDVGMRTVVYRSDRCVG